MSTTDPVIIDLICRVKALEAAETKRAEEDRRAAQDERERLEAEIAAEHRR